MLVAMMDIRHVVMFMLFGGMFVVVRVSPGL